MFFLLFSCNVMAENEDENNSSADTQSEAEVEINIEDEIEDEVDQIVNALETILDPENDELEKKAAETLEKHSDNWLVKLFKSIIDAISRFINAVLELASKAAKIGVD